MQPLLIKPRLSESPCYPNSQIEFVTECKQHSHLSSWHLPGHSDKWGCTVPESIAVRQYQRYVTFSVNSLSCFSGSWTSIPGENWTTLCACLSCRLSTIWSGKSVYFLNTCNFLKERNVKKYTWLKLGYCLVSILCLALLRCMLTNCRIQEFGQKWDTESQLVWILFRTYTRYFAHLQTSLK